MRRYFLAHAAAALAAAAFFPAQAQDIKAGQRKAIACQTCHGLDGLSKLPDAPNIAGQPVGYLERALRAFRGGARKNEMMSVAARTLSDDDIRDLAAYYGAIKVEVTLPQ
jgi:cytochrome c553